MPRRATLVPRQRTHMPAWAVVAVTLTGVGVAVAAGFVGLVWCVASVLFGPSDPERATMAVVAKGVKYDECSHQISARLERHYEWDRADPLDVTFVAYHPGGPAEGYRVTTRTAPTSLHFLISLTDEEAAAFGHPEARRTVTLRRADGQLVLAEEPWKAW